MIVVSAIAELPVKSGGNPQIENPILPNPIAAVPRVNQQNPHKFLAVLCSVAGGEH
jgi:hypothetical protein